MVENPGLAAPKQPLYGIFTDIPRRYDLINTVFTWGMDRNWRRITARECLTGQPAKILDLCCGTGDLAITLAGMAEYPAAVYGLDYSQPMLDIATRKAANQKKGTVTFTRGEAAQIPFAADYFDCVGVSFAFRNLTYRNPLAEKHLSEILRVLKPGGRLVMAESSQPRSRLIRAGYHFYMQQYAYRVGALLSGNRPAYRYLADSTCRYYSPEQLEQFLRRSGFRYFTSRPLLWGAGAVSTATK